MPVRSRVLGALGVCLLTLAVSAFSVILRPPLGAMGGLTDEWHVLGANLAVSGTLGLDAQPSVFRPPGYPAFIALPLLLAGVPEALSGLYLRHAEGLVTGSQCLVLALAAVALFLWLSTWLRPASALAGALFFGLNPWCVAWVGLLHYGVLHLLALVVGTALVHRLLVSGRDADAVAAGAAFGLAALVRPVTLPLPLFLLIALLLRGQGWRAVRSTALFSLVMLAVVAPWTLRNHAVSGRIIAVNDQARFVLWGATVRQLPADPEHYLWWEVFPEFQAVFTRVTGEPAYSLQTFVRCLPQLGAAYGEEAVANLRRQPGVYLHNVVRSAGTLAFQTSTALPRAFLHQRESRTPAAPGWFQRGLDPVFGREDFALGLRALGGALLALAWAGLALGVRGQAGVQSCVLVLACAGGAHAITHMDLLYYYIRLPFAAALASHFADRLPGALGAAAGWALTAGAALLTLLMLG